MLGDEGFRAGDYHTEYLAERAPALTSPRSRRPEAYVSQPLRIAFATAAARSGTSSFS